MGSPIRGVWCLLSLLGPEFASVPVQGEDLSGVTSGLQSAFLENRGQWPERVRFAARRHGWTAAVEGDALSFTCAVGGEGAAAERVSIRLRFEGASPLARAEGLGRRPAAYGFFQGNDPSRWQGGVFAYNRVLVRGLYDCADLQVREAGPGLEYDLLLAPGAPPAQVVVRCEGAESITVDSGGALEVRTWAGILRQKPPVSWQEGARGGRRLVRCRYQLLGADRFGYEVDSTDPELPLVIDPVVEWVSSFGGGDDERAMDLALDKDGNIVVAGWTRSLDFPAGPGGATARPAGGRDAFVLRLDGKTREVLSATLFGGAGDDAATAIAIDHDGNIAVAGVTGSEDFPATNGSVFAGGPGAPAFPGPLDAFVARFDPAAADLQFASYFGGSGGEWASAIAVEASGDLVVAGYTSSTDLPATPEAFQPEYGGGANDAFLARAHPSDGEDFQNQFPYVTYLGGTGMEVPVEFPAGINNCGPEVPFEYSGSFLTWGALALDAQGNAVFAGGTRSPNYPVSPGAFRAGAPSDDHRIVFVTDLLLDPSLDRADQLLYSTVIGGNNSNAGAGDLLVAPDGTLWVSGWAFSTDFPTTENALQTADNSPCREKALLFHLDPDPQKPPARQFLYSTYIGGIADAQPYSLTLRADGTIVLAGVVYSDGFPTTAQAPGPSFLGGRQDGFLALLDPSRAPREQLVFSSYLGGDLDDEVTRLILTPTGGVLALGQTGSTIFAGSGDLEPKGGQDVFLASLSLRFPRAAFTVSAAGDLRARFHAGASSTPAPTLLTGYAWDFGAGSTDSGSGPEHAAVEHAYTGAGRYPVTLTVTNDAGLDNSTMASATVACPGGGVSPWTGTDIGRPAFPGSARLEGAGEGASLRLCAGGQRIIGSDDEFFFVYREAAGDAVLTAHLVSTRFGTGKGPGVGVMVRETLDPHARSAALVSGLGKLADRMVARLRSGSSATAKKDGPQDPWLRLERKGDQFTGSVSADGVTWTSDPSWTIQFDALPETLLFGISALGADRPDLESFEPLQAVLDRIALEKAASTPLFRRADADSSGSIDLTDAVALLGYLFLGAEKPLCLDAADFDDSGEADISDAVANLSFQFLAGEPPAAPGPAACGPDAGLETPDLGCEGACR